MHDAQNMRGGGKHGADRQTELIAIMLLMIRKPERVSFFAFLFVFAFAPGRMHGRRKKRGRINREFTFPS